MRTIIGHPIPENVNEALGQRFGREYTLEHIILWVLEQFEMTALAIKEDELRRGAGHAGSTSGLVLVDSHGNMPLSPR